MQKVLLMTAAAVLMLAAPAIAQDSDDQKPAPSKTTAGDKKSGDQKAAEPKVVMPQIPQPTANVRVELTITDQRGDGVALTKTMSATVVDTGMSRIRTSGDVRTPLGMRPVTLNVDASPKVQRDGKIRLDLNFEYRPVAAEAETEKNATLGMTEMISVLLEDGKPTVISQSADPSTDRRVKVEAKATVIR
jgi:hypothetical protein